MPLLTGQELAGSVRREEPALSRSAGGVRDGAGAADRGFRPTFSRWRRPRWRRRCRSSPSARRSSMSGRPGFVLPARCGFQICCSSESAGEMVIVVRQESPYFFDQAAVAGTVTSERPLGGVRPGDLPAPDRGRRRSGLALPGDRGPAREVSPPGCPRRPGRAAAWWPPTSTSGSWTGSATTSRSYGTT